MSITYENVIGWLYLLCGPCAWGLLAFGMIKGRKRLSLLSRPPMPLPQPPPRASVLVPIKDEAHQIDQCMRSVLALRYPGEMEIIAIDDRSSDGTGAILDKIARDHPQLKIVHIRPGELPPGWVGKSHALHVGMHHAKGDWLLFVDSDVSLAPDTLEAVVGLAEHKRYDLVSLLPKLEAHTFWEKLIIPLGGAATSAMYTLPMTNYNELPKVAFANGQFMCVRRTAYEAIGRHEAVRETLSEDIAIARRLKLAGYRPRLAIGADWASTRMYSSLPAIMRGWSRNFFCGSAGRPWRVLAAILFVLVCCFSCYAAIGWGFYHAAKGWLISGLIHFAIMTGALVATYRWTGNPRRYALLFPLGGAMMIAIWLRTLKSCATGQVEWRGTRYAHRMGQGLVTPS